MPTRSRPEDFWANVDRGEGDPSVCWPWTGAMNEHGYGRVRYQGVEWKAHRLAWMLMNVDPGPLFVLHGCDNPPCCNPTIGAGHLFTGTQRDNMRDCASKGRHPRNVSDYLPRGDTHHSRTRPEVVARGERNGAAVLAEADVLAIRQGRLDGKTLQSLADEFGVAKGTINFIDKRKTWGHLP